MDKKYDAYIFDLDGTLLNTLGDLAASVNYALRCFDMPEHSIEDIRMFVGNGVRKLIERAVYGGENNPRFEEVLAKFREYYIEHGEDTTEPYPGILDLLAELKRRNCKIAVVSNKFDAATKRLCTGFFNGYVDVAIGEHEGVGKKPAPDMVEKAIAELGVCKECAVYVGDSDVDVATARNSGLPCVSVLWGFRDKEFLIRHGATEFVSRAEELIYDRSRV